MSENDQSNATQTTSQELDTLLLKSMMAPRKMTPVPFLPDYKPYMRSADWGDQHYLCNNTLAIMWVENPSSGGKNISPTSRNIAFSRGR